MPDTDLDGLLDRFIAADRSALILFDLQNGIAQRAEGLSQLLDAVEQLQSAAATADVPVFWTRHVNPAPPLLPEPTLWLHMKRQGAASADDIRPTMQDGTSDVAFLDGLKPTSRDVTLTKSTPSAFVGTSLELDLRARNCTTLVIAGVATDIGVELTARHAAALGLVSIVVVDAVASFSKPAHDRGLESLEQSVPLANTARIVASWGLRG